jgi:hypothetical protein
MHLIIVAKLEEDNNTVKVTFEIQFSHAVLSYKCAVIFQTTKLKNEECIVESRDVVVGNIHFLEPLF